jgi:hypothetical protein
VLPDSEFAMAAAYFAAGFHRRNFDAAEQPVIETIGKTSKAASSTSATRMRLVPHTQPGFARD